MASSPTNAAEDSSWLDSLGCCATPRREKASGSGDAARNGQASLEFEQPTRQVQPLIAAHNPRPTTSRSSRVSVWIENGVDRVRERAVSTGARPKRPRISAPTDFRRMSQQPPARPRGFRPLQLSIYLPDGRASPFPDFESSAWENKLDGLRKPAPALLRDEDEDEPEELRSENGRRKPMSMPNPMTDRISHASDPADLSFEYGPGPTLQSDEQNARWSQRKSDPRTPTMALDVLEQLIPLPPVQPGVQPSPALSSPGGRLRSPSPFSPSAWARAVTDSSRLSRSASLRVSKPDTVDEAIRELNTIIEERRQSALLKGIKLSSQAGSIPQSPTGHVPAIAPSMKMRVRSETLSDIGSAFSAPLSAKSLATPPLPPMPQLSQESAPVAPVSRPISAASSTTALPTVMTMPAEPVPALKPSTRARFSTWLRRSYVAPEEPEQQPAPIEEQPFYQLHNPALQAHPYIASRVSFSSVSSASARSERSSYTPATTTAASLTTASPRPGSVPEMPEAVPRASTSKAPLTIITTTTGAATTTAVPRSMRSIRRNKPRRGLSVETTASVASSSTAPLAPPPPPYQQHDPHPVSPVTQISPGRVGVAF